ncbi:MAG: trypsin-like peptidase domain-containing protein [Methanobacteriota archaeon]
MRCFLVLAAALVLASGCLGGPAARDTSDAASPASLPEGPARSGGAPEVAPETDDGTTAASPPQWPDVSEAVVRPGVHIVGGSCTANFVFVGDDGTTIYIGTAAHCVEDLDVGDAVDIADGRASGTLAYSSFETMEEISEADEAVLAYNDFALVRVDEKDESLVHPAILGFGGPTGLAEAPGVGARLLTYGHSSLRGDTRVLDPREGYVVASNPWYTRAYFAPPSLPGDSGSPVVSADGAAEGVLIHINVVDFGQGSEVPSSGSNGLVRLAPALLYAAEHGGPVVELATWEFSGA